MNTCFCCVEIAAVKAPVNEEEHITKTIESAGAETAASTAAEPPLGGKELLKEKLKKGLEVAGEKVGDGLLKGLLAAKLPLEKEGLSQDKEGAAANDVTESENAEDAGGAETEESEEVDNEESKAICGEVEGAEDEELPELEENVLPTPGLVLKQFPVVSDSANKTVVPGGNLSGESSIA